MSRSYESEDEFHELAGVRTLDLTDDEVTTLQEGDGQITWLSTRGGFFGLASEEPVDE